MRRWGNALMPQEAKIPLKKIPGIQATFTAAVKQKKKNDYHLSEELFRPVRTNTTLEFRKLTLLQQLHKDVLFLVSFPGRLLFSSGVQLFCTEQSRQSFNRTPLESGVVQFTAADSTPTSQVSVEVVHPFDFGLQFVPHGFLQSFSLGRTPH